MCQNQKFFLSSMSIQLQYILNLMEQLKNDSIAIYVNTVYEEQSPKAFQSDMTKQIEQMFSIFVQMNESFVKCFEYQDYQNFCEDESFQLKTYHEILGIQSEEIQDIEVDIQNSRRISGMQQGEKYFKKFSKSKSSFRGPYRSYTLEEKHKILKLYSMGFNYASISRKLKIPQKNIVRWCKNGVFRKKGAGRKVGDQSMQKNIIDWLDKYFRFGSFIRVNYIRERALEFSTKSGFKSSKGWVKNFIRRHRINEKYNLF